MHRYSDCFRLLDVSNTMSLPSNNERVILDKSQTASDNCGSIVTPLQSLDGDTKGGIQVRTKWRRPDRKSQNPSNVTTSGQCWAAVCDARPALIRRCADVSLKTMPVMSSWVRYFRRWDLASCGTPLPSHPGESFQKMTDLRILENEIQTFSCHSVMMRSVIIRSLF